MKTDYVKKILILMIIGILVFSGVGVVAITNNKETTITNSLATTDNHLPDASESSEEILSYGTILYAFISGGPMGTGFYAFGPEDIIRFSMVRGETYFTL